MGSFPSTRIPNEDTADQHLKNKNKRKLTKKEESFKKRRKLNRKRRTLNRKQNNLKCKLLLDASELVNQIHQIEIAKDIEIKYEFEQFYAKYTPSTYKEFPKKHYYFSKYKGEISNHIVDQHEKNYLNNLPIFYDHFNQPIFYDKIKEDEEYSEYEQCNMDTNMTDINMTDTNGYHTNGYNYNGCINDIEFTVYDINKKKNLYDSQDEYLSDDLDLNKTKTMYGCEYIEGGGWNKKNSITIETYIDLENANIDEILYNYGCDSNVINLLKNFVVDYDWIIQLEQFIPQWQWIKWFTENKRQLSLNWNNIQLILEIGNVYGFESNKYKTTKLIETGIKYNIFNNN